MAQKKDIGWTLEPEFARFGVQPPRCYTFGQLISGARFVGFSIQHIVVLDAMFFQRLVLEHKQAMERLVKNPESFKVGMVVLVLPAFECMKLFSWGETLASVTDKATGDLLRSVLSAFCRLRHFYGVQNPEKDYDKKLILRRCAVAEEFCERVDSPLEVALMIGRVLSHGFCAFVASGCNQTVEEGAPRAGKVVTPSQFVTWPGFFDPNPPAEQGNRTMQLQGRFEDYYTLVLLSDLVAAHATKTHANE